MASTATHPYFLDEEALQRTARAAHEAYVAADPFPHCVLEDLLPADEIARVLAEFPEPGDPVWSRYEHKHSVKLALSDDTKMGPDTRHMIGLLNSAPFLRFLETLTGIEGLVPDPYLEGGGYHRIERGGRLEIHADFNRHERLKLDRRLNLLLFLNRDWEEEFGGQLELWSRDMQGCVKSVLPVFNRIVIFSTTDDAYHGHPHPLTCPEDRARLSLALYYYSAGRPDHEVSDKHSTLYQRRPGAPHPKGGLLRRVGRALRGKG